jgi:hypothetical protein
MEIRSPVWNQRRRLDPARPAGKPRDAMRTILILLLSALVAPLALAAGDAPYRHIVLFKFADDAPAEKIRAVEKAFAALPSQIDTIKGYEWGTNVSPENLAQGFTHCFLVTFADKAGLETYLPHPAHKAFGKSLSGLIDKVLVIDFVDQGEPK